ncbi:myb/SANT-like DNA-binding domain-containing protein 2 [Stegodyphus dumicola]|uniref:myb/SANT-like DNA-binding domain-containing protein 2 n=1 Tax=Stegodyphus dumicola TaxID=202533 RepID=UPI0015A7A330|nr:myb/SANT-like DNA-binding domain-containing protein 2 [Stegodyphus dumicola]
MCAAITADRGFTWSDEETSLLLQLWGANDAQSELTGNKRNFVVYEKISETMSSMGFIRTASQCREKIKRMKREYTLTKQYNEKSNGPKKSMRFYEQFEKLLLEKQARNQKNTALRSCPNSSGLESEADEAESTKKRTWERNQRKIKPAVPKSEPPMTRKRRESLDKDVKNLGPDVL